MKRQQEAGIRIVIPASSFDYNKGYLSSTTWKM